MNQTKQSTPRPFTHLYAVSVLLLLAFGSSPETAQAQWTTDTNIHNTNTGNVGIGTAAPTAKLDVQGSATFSGSTTVAGRGTFFIDDSNRLNFTVWSNGVFKINASSLMFNGAFETFNNSFGVRRASDNILTVHVPYSGSAYFNQGNVGIGTAAPANQLHVHNPSGPASMRVSGAGWGALNFIDSSAAANSKLFQWRSEGGLFRMALVNDAENAYVQQNLLVAHPSGNVGIGTAAPAYKLDVSGEINATGLRINGTPVGAGGGSSPWATGSGNVYYNSGNVGIGTTTPAAKLDVVGNLNVSGTITGGVIEAKYQDMAEWVPSSQKLEAGMVVTLDPEKSNHVLASSEAYDTKVAGVVSAQPGISLGERGEGKVLVATTGRVRVRVDATRAPIKIGDLLVTSDIAGVAMKSQPISVGGRQLHAPGTLVGKALEPLANGTGQILVLLSLQ